MKKLIGFLIIVLLLALLVLGGMLATGADSMRGLLDELIGNPAIARETSDQTNSPSRVYSLLSDHKPPVGDGEQLTGDLPEDLLPDAESLYSFSEERYPYRAMLTDTEQSAYDQVYAYAMALYRELPLHTPVSVDSVSRVMSAVFYDHPELFWVDTDYRYSYTSQDSVVAVTLTFNETAADIQTHRTRFEQAAQTVIQGAMELDTAVEREKYVHDYLLDHVSYQLDAALSQSAYSALVYGESVCAGYSRAFQYILQELGIPCYYCSGDAGESHAWNMVGLEDGFYHVDVTWDDPIGNDTGMRFYNYFNLTDGEIEDDHIRTGLSVYLPACTATEFSYRNVFGEPEVYIRGLRTVEDTGLRPEDVITGLEAYYRFCEDALAARGAGTHTLTMLLDSEQLLDHIFLLTESGEAMRRYVADAAQQLGYAGYSVSVSLQGEPLEQEYWLLTQQISLEEQTAEDSHQLSTTDPEQYSSGFPEEDYFYSEDRETNSRSDPPDGLPGPADQFHGGVEEGW